MAVKSRKAGKPKPASKKFVKKAAVKAVVIGDEVYTNKRSEAAKRAARTRMLNKRAKLRKAAEDATREAGGVQTSISPSEAPQARGGASTAVKTEGVQTIPWRSNEFSCAGMTYYQSEAFGNDGNDGLSHETPVKTVGRVIQLVNEGTERIAAEQARLAQERADEIRQRESDLKIDAILKAEPDSYVDKMAKACVERESAVEAERREKLKRLAVPFEFAGRVVWVHTELGDSRADGLSPETAVDDVSLAKWIAEKGIRRGPIRGQVEPNTLGSLHDDSALIDPTYAEQRKTAAQARQALMEACEHTNRIVRNIRETEANYVPISPEAKELLERVVASGQYWDVYSNGRQSQMCSSLKVFMDYHSDDDKPWDDDKIVAALIDRAHRYAEVWDNVPEDERQAIRNAFDMKGAKPKPAGPVYQDWNTPVKSLPTLHLKDVADEITKAITRDESGFTFDDLANVAMGSGTSFTEGTTAYADRAALTTLSLSDYPEELRQAAALILDRAGDRNKKFDPTSFIFIIEAVMQVIERCSNNDDPDVMLKLAKRYPATIKSACQNACGDQYERFYGGWLKVGFWKFREERDLYANAMYQTLLDESIPNRSQRFEGVVRAAVRRSSQA